MADIDYITQEEYHALLWEYIHKHVKEAIIEYQIDSIGSAVQLTSEDVEKILLDAVLDEPVNTVHIHTYTNCIVT